jgi:hypothetical protein
MTMASGLYVLTFRDALDTSNLAIDMLLNTHKVALFLDALTPNFDTNQDFTAAPYTSNQSSGTGYTAGGRALSVGTVTNSDCVPTWGLGATGQLKYDLTTDVGWASPTTVTARGSVLYADALATNDLIVAQTFGSDFTSTAGTFTIQLDALGWFTIDLVP